MVDSTLATMREISSIPTYTFFDVDVSFSHNPTFLSTNVHVRRDKATTKQNKTHPSSSPSFVFSWNEYLLAGTSISDLTA